MNESRASWSGSIAFILAAAASAIGLGNLWRFPYLATKYGGGVFIFTYLILSLTLGFAMVITEIALGRRSRQSQITAFSALGFPKWAWVGFLATLVPYLIAPYYAVIGGWVVKYFILYLKAVTIGGVSFANSDNVFGEFVSGFAGPFVYMSVFIVLTIAVILMGVKKGIEKANLILMPALFLMALSIAIWVACQPGAISGIKYYLIPDFSKVDNYGKIILGAMGQMFFSLSIAMGIMITYGSYMRRDGSIPKSAVRIALADTGVAILSGFMVVPVVFLFAPDKIEKSGPGMLFETIPMIFDRLGSIGSIVGLVFFTLVLFAALTSAISMSEACVAAICDRVKMPRTKAAVLFGIFCVVCGSVSAYSTDALSLIDAVVNSAIMPICAIGISLFAGYAIGPGKIMSEIRLGHGAIAFGRIYAVAMRYVVPLLIAAILVSEICRSFGIGGWTI